MKTFSNKQYGAAIAVLAIVTAITAVVLQWAGHHGWEMGFLFFFCLGAYFEAENFLRVSADAFVVKDGKVLSIIPGPCMVWMRGTMKGCEVINYSPKLFKASLKVTFALARNNGAVVEMIMSVSAEIGESVEGLGKYYQKFERGGEEANYLKKILVEFHKEKGLMSIMAHSKTIGENFDLWKESILKPRLKQYMQGRLLENGLVLREIIIPEPIIFEMKMHLLEE